MSPDSIKLVEALLVACVLVIQIIVFARTWSRISDFRRLIPETAILRIANVSVPTDEMQTRTPQEIIVKYASAGGSATFGLNPEEEEGRPEPVSLLLVGNKNWPLFEQIRYAINNYLIRNRGAATDFNLIKDVVERNTSAVEEDINLSVAVPLYLGLMGTMLGIVIGLFSMPDIGQVISANPSSGGQLDKGIDMLIAGVRVAMIASFIGLLLTVVNSGWYFRAARRHVEARKNELYTFVQIELLPIINQGMAATLDSLQRNLLSFNYEFKSNLEGLKEIFDSNKQAVRVQKQLLDTIAKGNIAEMAKYNVKVLSKLEGSVAQLERFQDYLVQVNFLVGGTQQIVSGVNGFLARTEEVKRVADTIDQRLHESGRLLEFLTTHFSKLEEHKAYTAQAVADVGHAISGTFHELKDHIGKSTDAVKQFTVDELDALRAALAESRTNLSNLGHLEALAKDVSQMKVSTASQMERVKGELNSTVKTLEELSEGLKAVNAHLSSKSMVASVKSSLSKLWGKKRNDPGRNHQRP
jgi:hypothetical protein